MIKLLNFILKLFGFYCTVVRSYEFDNDYNCRRPVYVCRIRRIK